MKGDTKSHPGGDVKRERGLISLVGAGPGDPGLLTCRAVEVLERADVVLYDRLVDPAVLEYARQAERIYVGKRPEHHSMSQDEINALLVRRAEAGARVVRLKGGDPFVFGRGGEEALAAREAGVRFEVVPGITSALAAPAYAGVPVTHRELAAGVTVVTGHEDPEKLETQVDWARLAAAHETLVILMGMGRLAEITTMLTQHGRPSETPVAVIENGARASQRSLFATLQDVAERVREAGLSSPAVVVVGEVASLGETLAWVESRPLSGLRILVTRARAQAGELSRRLRAEGAEALEFPTIEIRPPAEYAPLDRALACLGEYAVVAFTSVNGVEAVLARLHEQFARDARAFAGCEIWAIGPKTAEALAAHGLRADFVPREYRAEALLAACKSVDLRGRRFLLPRADIARAALAEGLAERGAVVEQVDAYRTFAVGGAREAVLERLEAGTLDVVTFTSSSTVRNFVSQFSDEEVVRLRDAVVFASIGPITSETARELGVPPSIEASEYTLEGLVEALIAYHSGVPRD